MRGLITPSVADFFNTVYILPSVSNYAMPKVLQNKSKSSPISARMNIRNMKSQRDSGCIGTPLFCTLMWLGEEPPHADHEDMEEEDVDVGTLAANIPFVRLHRRRPAVIADATG